MTYKEFIDNILNTRGRFAIPKNEYKERHHIIPKCMGGNNEKDNLIDLYAREHFIAHKLLVEENPDSSVINTSVSNILYVGEQFSLNVIADFDNDTYKVVVTELKEAK